LRWRWAREEGGGCRGNEVAFEEGTTPRSMKEREKALSNSSYSETATGELQDVLFRKKREGRMRGFFFWK
jgi:hypothetical protein